ncbi:DUF2461 domain-containing protein [Aureibacter tunicatorum]|uniref:Uncharacterized protein (TIGR02453 family) n=1 Tax=Aureibacter tunicatorum TaxID=866807 RepID=A0AAE4BSE9_9BACT|nr:DUF2461 domain-containing protein [Aureibacter tunicatorum]MDR6239681.1 uncharacterized protein (TIGR02453 family) [Aureibacter tunicatorum]BDD04157.1 TIGR02453 family protein [Aureibacter tunicatorum]
MNTSTSTILNFLSELSENNNKEWMDEHRAVYHESRDLFIEIVARLIEGTSKFDDELGGLEPKKCIFRLNRDIRFSKDKSPYKLNFGAAFSEEGKSVSSPGYYFHIQPGGESFVGGGMYMPEPAQLKKIRQEIDYNGRELKAIVDQEDFVNEFGSIQGEKLKRPPKGYQADHPNIELLKMKGFIVLKSFSDDDLLKDSIIDDVVDTFAKIKPLKDYLSVAIS